MYAMYVCYARILCMRVCMLCTYVRYVRVMYVGMFWKNVMDVCVFYMLCMYCMYVCYERMIFMYVLKVCMVCM